MATANPAMNEAVYGRVERAYASSQVMTIQGTVVKTGILMVVLLATAGYAWTQAVAGSPLTYNLLIGGMLGGFITSLVTIFVPRFAPVTAPIYAALEGLVLGVISVLFETKYPGIVLQAVELSIGVLAVMLFVYGTRIIQATERFRIGIVAATGAICLVYVVNLVASLFGTRLPFIHESGMFGIAFSMVVVVVAALNLILNFDFIERGAELQAPKSMEWYAGFSLLVTLVWMYLEILRLLSKMRSRD